MEIMSGIHTSYSSAKNISHSVDGGGGGGGVGGGGGNVIHYSSNPEPPVISFNITIPAAAPTSTPNLLPPTEKTVHDDTSHILIYVLVPLGALIVIAALSFLVSNSFLCSNAFGIKIRRKCCQANAPTSGKPCTYKVLHLKM